MTAATPGARARRKRLAGTTRFTVLLIVLAALALWVSRSPVPSVHLADGLVVRCLNSSAWPTVGRQASGFALTVAAHEVPEIELVSQRALSSLTLEFASRSAAGLEIEGGLLTQTILRPDGRVLFEIALASVEARRWPWPWKATYRYPLKWVMPEAPGGPLGLTLRAEPEILTP